MSSLMKSNGSSLLFVLHSAACEDLLWQEADALQFPELSATPACPPSQGYLQEGKPPFSQLSFLMVLI